MPTSRLGIWLMAARPRTLWAATAPVIMGTAMAKGDGSFHLLSALAALFGALMIQIGTNFANDYFDFSKGADSSDRTGPTRVTQSGLVSPDAIRRAIWIAFSLAFCAGIYLVTRGGIPIVIIGLLSILFGLLYTGGPFPLGYNGLGEFFVLIFFGPVAVGGTYFVQTLTITDTVIIAGLSPGLLSVAILSVNNLRDIDGDARAGKNTLAVRFGRTFAQYEYLLCTIVAILIPSIMVYLSGIEVNIFVTLAALLPAIPALIIVMRGGEGEALNRVLATTGRVLLFFAILFSIGWLW